MQFDINWKEVAADGTDSPEAATRCTIALSAENLNVFQHEDLLNEHQVSSCLDASAYPLAQWLVANWWRLRWEPELTDPSPEESQDWAMSHSLGAAAYGYSWPNASFASDGESIRLRLKPSQEQVGPVRFINQGEVWIPGSIFENGVEHFVSNTLGQLDKRHQSKTDLHDLWQILQEERQDSELADYRKLEARLGFDPEEAPKSLIQNLLGLFSEFGQEAIEELTVVGASRINEVIDNINARLQHSKDELYLESASLKPAICRILAEPAMPWQKGSKLAHVVRSSWGVGPGRLSNQKFGECLHLSAKSLESQVEPSEPVSAGKRQESGSNVRIALGKSRATSRRFMLARIVGDQLYTKQEEKLLPCTSGTTYRQKVQRSFAQELLCPYQDLISWLDTTNPDEEQVEAAAEHFIVSPLMIESILVNHGFKRELLA